MKELERKFLIKQLPEGLEWIDIQQGYLMQNPSSRQLRVRIQTDGNGVRAAHIAFKVNAKSGGRDEYEYPVPIGDAEELIQHSELVLQKRRASLSFEGFHIDIDSYPDGMQVAEIEYSEGQTVLIPEWFGEEVTGQIRYSNIAIAFRQMGGW